MVHLWTFAQGSGLLERADQVSPSLEPTSTHSLTVLIVVLDLSQKYFAIHWDKICESGNPHHLLDTIKDDVRLKIDSITPLFLHRGALARPLAQQWRNMHLHSADFCLAPARQLAWVKKIQLQDRMYQYNVSRVKVACRSLVRPYHAACKSSVKL